MSLRKLSIVVPTYNEKDNIYSLVELVDEALRGIPYEIIFVDDSTDSTPEILKDISEKDGRVRFEHRIGEKGLSTAVMRGFELADGDYIAVMDADLQHPPAVLRSMYCAMGNHADICIPSRFIKGGSDGGLDPVRKLVSATARYIGKIVLPCLRHVSDPTGGLFMFRKDIMRDADMRPIGWKILIEVLATCRYDKIIEIPYEFSRRNAGQSKLSGRVTLEYLKQVAMLVPRAVQNNTTVIRWTPERMAERVAGMDEYIAKNNR